MKLLAALSTLLCAALRAGTARAQLVTMYICEDADGVTLVWEGVITDLSGLLIANTQGAPSVGQNLWVGGGHQVSIFPSSLAQWVPDHDRPNRIPIFDNFNEISGFSVLNRYASDPAVDNTQQSMGVFTGVAGSSDPLTAGPSECLSAFGTFAACCTTDCIGQTPPGIIYFPIGYNEGDPIAGQVTIPGQTFASLLINDAVTSTVTWGNLRLQSYTIITNQAACGISAAPSLTPSLSPSALPSLMPSVEPSALPSLMPSTTPSLMPSTTPSLLPSATPSLSLMPSAACEDTCMLPSKGKGGRSVRNRGTKGSKGKDDGDESAAPSASPGFIVCVFSPGGPSGKGKGRHDRELRTHSSAGKGSGPFLETRCVASFADLLSDETFVNCGCCAVEVPDLGEVCVDSTCSATPEL